MKALLLLLSLIVTLPCLAEKWDPENDPLNFLRVSDTVIFSEFDLLPLRASLDDSRLGWSETYWPANKGGIAYRWNSPDPRPFEFIFKTKEQLKRMGPEELGQLSPAELYDIAVGDYSYSLTRKTLSLFRPTDLWWEGICHGWALAASNYPEPMKVIVTNPEGIRVPFGSSDVKGLLSMHEAYNSSGVYAHVGARCAVEGKVPGEASVRDQPRPPVAAEDAERPECRDVNAGAFHVVLANMIGIQSRGLVADVDRFSDVWNQPVVSYGAEILEELEVTHEQRLQGVSRRIRIRNRMTYGEELQFFNSDAMARNEHNFVSKNPVTRTPSQAFRWKDYEYVLELDAWSRVIGGEWLSETRPDFLWTKIRDQKFLNFPLPLKGLSRIYRPVKY